MSAGLQLAARWGKPQAWTLTPRASLAFVHDFSTTRQVDAALQLLPEQSFTVFGAPGLANAAAFSLQLTASHRSGFSAFASMDGQLSDRGSGWLASGGVRYRF